MEKGRRKKVRYIQTMPKVTQFSPRGKPGRPDEVELTIDEFEAVKVADHLHYDQSEGAVQMGLSRPSFGRILRSARSKIADALVSGKIIRIRTGNVQVGVRHKELSPKKPSRSSQSVEQKIRSNMLDFSPDKLKGDK